MSPLLKTKPAWGKNVIATDHGWKNSVTNELYVSYRNLKTLLEQEEAKKIKVKPKKEIIMEKELAENMELAKKEVVQKRAYNKKPKVIGEAVEHGNKNIIAEVVEYDLGQTVIGE